MAQPASCPADAALSRLHESIRVAATSPCRCRQRQADQLTYIQRALDGHRIADPAHRRVLVARRQLAVRDVGHEREVQAQAFAAGGVLLVADQTGRPAVDAQARREDALQARLFTQLAPGRCQRRRAALDLAADGEPQLEALVAHEQDLPAVAAEDRDGERAPFGRHLSVKATTPGRALPSRNSSEAPPPVETCETLLATPAFFTAEAESPPPMMVVAPAAVAFARASALPTVRPLKSSLSVTTKSVPRTSLPPASAIRLLASSSLSFSTIDLPTSRPCAFR